MDFINHTILSWILVAPLIGALLALVLPAKSARLLALLASAITLLLSIHLPVYFAAHTPGMQFEQIHAWIPALNISYHVGVDGISLWLVPLATLLSFLGVLVSWKSIKANPKLFYILLLLLETGMVGVFVSLDFFLFYLAWEAMLVPMILIIGGWGHAGRIRAALQFFVYTMIGSMLMLGAILTLYHASGTFDFITIRDLIASGRLHLSGRTETALFLAFLLAFAIKMPIFPVYTWQPDAYTEAPVAGSLLVAGVLAKMGAYGLLRFNISLFPTASHRFAPLIITLGLIGLLYGALLAFVQTDIKRLVAYGSLSHMGLVAMGIFSFTSIGTQGAIFEMLAHGIATGGLFVLLGMLWDRHETYEHSKYGGLASPMPVFAGFFLLMVMSSVGLPLLNGFVGEFLILIGSFLARPIYGIVGTLGIITAAMYLLRWTWNILWGEPAPATAGSAAAHDINARERFVLAVFAIFAVGMGVAPRIFLRDIAPTVDARLAPAAVSAPAATPIAAALPLSAMPVLPVRPNAALPLARPTTSAAARHTAVPSAPSRPARTPGELQ